MDARAPKAGERARQVILRLVPCVAHRQRAAGHEQGPPVKPERAPAEPCDRLGSRRWSVARQTGQGADHNGDCDRDEQAHPTEPSFVDGCRNELRVDDQLGLVLADVGDCFLQGSVRLGDCAFELPAGQYRKRLAEQRLERLRLQQ
eukprot:1410618-Prymnesium_polylepis.1